MTALIGPAAALGVGLGLAGPEEAVVGAGEAPSALDEIFVSPFGSDQASGTRHSPLRTLEQALSRADGGETIVLRGAHSAIDLREAFSSRVLIVGAGRSRPTIAGADLRGAQRVTFKRIHFTKPVLVTQHPLLLADQPARRLVFTRSEFSTFDFESSAGSCLFIRDGSTNIRVTRSHLHDCRSGIAGPSSASSIHSQKILIEDNVIEDMREDGIRFGRWDRVVIRHNVIHGMSDPADRIHTDGIQLFGHVSDVDIIGNRIFDSSHGQLIFIQAALGPISDVSVINNLIFNSSGIAVQNVGAQDSRFINNTIWNTGGGGLRVLKGHAPQPARGTVVVNNISETIRFIDGASPRFQGFNLIGEHADRDGRLGRGDIVDPHPSFRSPQSENFRLKLSSRAVDHASRRFSPRRDIDGRWRGRRPNIGAFELARGRK